MTRAVGIVVAGAGLAVGVQAEYFAIQAHWTESYLLDVAVGWVFIGAGLVAWGRRPKNRMGLLMVVFGFTWFIGNLAATGVPLLTSVGTGFEGINGAILAQLLLAYPTGRLAARGERALVAAIYVWIVVEGIARTLTFDPSGAFAGCRDCPHGSLASFPSAFPTVDNVGTVGSAVAALAVLALLLARYLRATPPARRALRPLWVAGILTAAVYVLEGVAATAAGSSLDTTSSELQRVAELAIPLAFLFGLLRSRRERSPIGDLVVALGRPLPPGGLRCALAQALGDPSLELAFGLPGGGFVDDAGRPLALPADDRSRVATLIERDGRPVAALIHDAALVERQPVVEAAGAAARLALENERLHAELRAQLEEVRASRARIIGAGDAERRRLERDLHDGAQQRLIALSLALTLARAEAGSVDSGVLDASLAEAAAEARLALDELRELARGLHPSILTEAGIGPALESLAERCTVPVAVKAAPLCRLPQPVEATAYFVASEALANAAKHAHASTVTVEVRRQNGGLLLDVYDDGVGGADPGGGSGLRGLEDRLAAVGGRLHLTSHAGAGTRLTVEIPCE